MHMRADFCRQICVFPFSVFSPSKPDLGSQGFGDLLACIRDKNIPLQNIHFVVRNICTLNLLLYNALIRLLTNKFVPSFFSLTDLS